MRYLILGAAGFIGGHLMEKLLKEGNEVKGIDNFWHASRNPIRKKVDNKDIRYYKMIEPYVEWADVVCHGAAQIHVDRSNEDPHETIDINVGGTTNILEACRKYKKKIVFASTSEVYGSGKSEKMNEDHPLDAQSVYGASKVAGDRLCKAYRDTYGLDVTILRNFNTFGPYQNMESYGGVIAKFTYAALQNKNLTIYGTGEQKRDYMWISDALEGYQMCFENDIDVINVGSGKTISINEIAEMIIKITESKGKIIHGPARPGEVQMLCADITKAKKYGFNPSTNFEKHLASYIQWFKQNMSIN